MQSLMVEALSFLSNFTIHFLQVLHTSFFLDNLLIILKVPYNLDTLSNTKNLFHERPEEYRATDLNLVLFLWCILLFPKFSHGLSEEH